MSKLSFGYATSTNLQMIWIVWLVCDIHWWAKQATRDPKLYTCTSIPGSNFPCLHMFNNWLSQLCGKTDVKMRNGPKTVKQCNRFIKIRLFSSLRNHWTEKSGRQIVVCKMPSDQWQNAVIFSESQEVHWSYGYYWILGISRDSWHKRRNTGGKKKAIRKKRKYELGRPPANTKVQWSNTN